MIYFILLIFSICLSYAQYKIARFNIGSKWNGYGVIEGVVSKNIQAPMVYRVLVPWIIGKNKTLWKYELCQTILIYCSLLSIYIAWNTLIVLISVILLTLTFWYDYWDWNIELIGFMFGLMSLPLALLGVILLGMSRETAPLIGLIYILHSHDYLGGSILILTSILILIGVRMIQGKHDLYCKRFMIVENWNLLKNYNVQAWLSVLLCTLGIIGAWNRPEFIIVPVITILGMTMAKINETRVFVGVVPYAALLISGWIK